MSRRFDREYAVRLAYLATASQPRSHGRGGITSAPTKPADIARRWVDEAFSYAYGWPLSPKQNQRRNDFLALVLTEINARSTLARGSPSALPCSAPLGKPGVSLPLARGRACGILSPP